MTPQLALRGRLIAAAAALFVAVGSVHKGAWPLVFIGVVTVCTLAVLFVWFYPTAIFLRRHKVELAWWVPPGDQPGGALTVGLPFTLHVALRNRGQRPLRVIEAHVFASSALEVPPPLATTVPPGDEIELTATLRARACGHWVLHGALIRLADALGLFEVRAYFPSPIGLKVFPKLGPTRAGQLVLRPQVGALHERVGVHTIRRRGMMGELREIREHAHGDPFKFIAWKATARKRQLMVRELESEIVVSHEILVDMAATMRTGEPGATRLDYAIETAAALARTALEGGDRVGLCTFDTRVFGQVKTGEGRPHFLRVVDKLVETKNVVDADLTELTDGELVAAVARYLLHQEGMDLRLRRAPPKNDPAWSKIAAGPAGELYDLSALSDTVGGLLRGRPGAGRQGAPHEAARVRQAPTSGFWSRMTLDEANASEAERLRAFCRLRGVELPYRQSVQPGRRAAGLSEAFHKVAAAGRSQLVIVFTDLEGILDDAETCRKAMGLLARRRHRLFVVVPAGEGFGPTPKTDAGERVAQVFAEEEQRRLAHARLEVLRAGGQVVIAGRHDGAEGLIRKLMRARQRAA